VRVLDWSLVDDKSDDSDDDRDVMKSVSKWPNAEIISDQNRTSTKYFSSYYYYYLLFI